jgi:nicotinamide-nucleotide amidase
VVWIGLSTPDGDWAWKFNFSGDRVQNKQDSADAALSLILQYLKEEIHIQA